MKSKKTKYSKSKYKLKKYRHRKKKSVFARAKRRFSEYFSYWTKQGYRKQRNWIDLDNASKLFPSVMNATDTKVFRFTATVKDDIDPKLLQMALDQSYKHFPLYRGVLRRGIFWYYYEESDLHPVVEKETDYPCRSLFHYDEKQLLFRVLYYRNRIHLEVFHALSDGTGASWFLQLLITNYVLLRYPESRSERIELPEEFQYTRYESGSQLDDSFTRYFNKKKNEKSINVKEMNPDESEKRKWKRVYQIYGRKTQDNRMQIIESEMPAKDLLKISKDRNITLSVLLTAIFIESIHKTIKRKNKERSVTISVPINLRQFYQSHSARNFFATTLIGYTFGQEGKTDTFDEICECVAEQYSTATKVENIEHKLFSLVKLEKNLALRIIIRPLKNLILRLANKINNLSITAALSNMGKISFPKNIEEYVDQIYVYITASRPQFACITHKGILTINFSSPYQDTEIQMNFLRRLTEMGIPVTIGANDVNPPNTKQDADHSDYLFEQQLVQRENQA
ncbi:MAG TPA: alcohol acetyltransferase [Clostridiaceae bacterium]|nr:alcohol acetyltransferase [Clostridiaceae bacterium]